MSRFAKPLRLPQAWPPALTRTPKRWRACWAWGLDLWKSVRARCSAWGCRSPGQHLTGCAAACRVCDATAPGWQPQATRLQAARAAVRPSWQCASRAAQRAEHAACCRAVINRFGFNSAGVDVVGANLAAFRDRTNYEPARSLRPGLVGVNVGKNKARLACCCAASAAGLEQLLANTVSAGPCLLSTSAGALMLFMRAIQQWQMHARVACWCTGPQPHAAVRNGCNWHRAAWAWSCMRAGPGCPTGTAHCLWLQVTDDAAADYVLGIAKLAQHADYLVINVSSPNTPGAACWPASVPATCRLGCHASEPRLEQGRICCHQQAPTLRPCRPARTTGPQGAGGADQARQGSTRPAALGAAGATADAGQGCARPAALGAQGCGCRGAAAWPAGACCCPSGWAWGGRCTCQPSCMPPDVFCSQQLCALHVMA